MVKFESKMFHPNIYNDGGICLDILQNQWSPIYDISAILTSIQACPCCTCMHHARGPVCISTILALTQSLLRKPNLHCSYCSFLAPVAARS